MPSRARKAKPIAFKPGELYSRAEFTEAPGCSESSLARIAKDYGLRPDWCRIGQACYIRSEAAIEFIQAVNSREQAD